ncbi:Alcohol dehydrogenase superfamily, zinc-type [Parasponia andersonii]|uniref:Alcohol dehydrogenase superfamily, zinc-type n=1 Tax=Parasponia andersonii TaxID=3476 RepID=A0A2P5CHQ8_PARAD|nr:Alcohol dehydrogenase superfamily, zinc-type [Parasponia andersonii]
MTGRGADNCFECVGPASVVQEAYACWWGKTIVLGADKPGSEVTLPSTDILHSGKTLLGSLFGGIKPRSDIPVLLKRYELQLDEFVTHEVSFEDINKAFDLLNDGHCLRCVIRMD